MATNTKKRDCFKRMMSSFCYNVWQQVLDYLRLPTGIFYKPGVKQMLSFLTSVLPAPSENRHDRHETYSDENPDGRFRRFTIGEIMERDKTSLDIFWVKDKSLADLDNLPNPDVLAAEIVEYLESAMDSFKEIVTALAD